MTDLEALGEQLSRLDGHLDDVLKGGFGNIFRYPKGSSQGGEFAPKGGGGGSAAASTAGKEAVLHPHPNDKGEPVEIKNPTTPSHADTWHAGNATFTPGSEAPESLHGVGMSSWKDAPTSKGDWQAVTGQKPEVEPSHGVHVDDPKHVVGAGVVIREPDGRIWLTKPTNHYGGYLHTFPKGTVEPEIPSLQANAIKEAHEETGLKVRITGHIGDFARTTSTARFYSAERVGGTPKDMGWETQAMRLVTPEQAHKLLNSSTDRDILAAALHHFGTLQKAYNAKQDRWPKGTPLGGQWKGSGAGGFTAPPKKLDAKTGRMTAGIGSKANPEHGATAEKAYSAAQKGDTAFLHAVAAKTSGAAHGFATGAQQGFHAKQQAKLHQYVSALISESTGKDHLEATASKLAGPEKLSDLGEKTAAKPGGSNPGAIHGQWLVKGNAQKVSGAVNAATSDDRAKNEVLAAHLINHVAPGHASEMKLVDLEGKHGGGLGVASKMIQGAQHFDPKSEAHVAEARKTFALHAWLGNYDAVGMSHDNLMMKDGKAVNIDPGGALLFRAQGLKKTDFGPKADTYDTMRDPSINKASASVYGGMSHSELKASAEQLTHISDETVHAMVNAHGPGNAAEKTALANTLIARKADILQRAGVSTGGAEHPGVSKPVFNSGHQSDAYYQKLADKAETHHAAGDADKLAAMGQTKQSGPKAGKPAWPEHTENGKAMWAYHNALSADLGAKQAPVKAAEPPKPPKAPDSEGKPMLPSAATVKGSIDSLVAGAKSPAEALAALHTVKSGWQQEADKAVMADNHAMAHLSYTALDHLDGHIAQQEAKAKAEVKTETPTPKAQPEAVKPALPNFEAHKLPETNSNAPSHNKKIDQIAALASKGDVEGLQGLKIGTNTYGKKQASLVNDSLKALGHDGKAAAPSTAATEKAPAPKAVKAEPKIVIPQAPNFKEWNGPGKGLSSKAHVNEQNQALADKLHKLGLQHDAEAVKGATFHALDKETGERTGDVKPISEHPSQHVKGYQNDVVHAIMHPQEALHTARVALGEGFKDLAAKVKAFGDPAKLADAKAKIGRYAVLGKLQGALKDWNPVEKSKGNGQISASILHADSHANYNKLSATEKNAIKDYTGGGYQKMNNAVTGIGSHSSTDYAIAGIKKAAVPLEEGTILSRKFSPDAAAMTKLMSAEPGTVIKDMGIISTSLSPNVWSGQVQLRIKAGEGAKGLYVAPKPGTSSGAISNHPGEDEVIMPYGSKFMVQKVHPAGTVIKDKHGTWGAHGARLVDVVALPD